MGIGADTARRHPFSSLLCGSLAVECRAANRAWTRRLRLYSAHLAAKTRRKVLNTVKGEAFLISHFSFLIKNDYLCTRFRAK